MSREDVLGTLMPLELAILEALTAEGARRGKYLNDADDVAALLKKLNDRELTPGNVAGRLRHLSFVGYVAPAKVVNSKGTSVGYQRTAAGQKALDAKGGGNERDGTAKGN